MALRDLLHQAQAQAHAALVLGMVTFGFGLLNVPGIVMSIFIGLLLIAVIALPRLARRFAARRA